MNFSKETVSRNFINNTVCQFVNLYLEKIFCSFSHKQIYEIIAILKEQARQVGSHYLHIFTST